MRLPAFASLLPVVALALAAAACSSSSSGSSGAGGASNTEPPAMMGMTAAHNMARADVKPAANPPIPPLTWSGDVAEYAQSWANNCQFMHSGGMYGENIFAGTGSYKPADVVMDWVSEDANYDYATNSCASGAVCGHYTQVVWRDSARLGCGMTLCTESSPFGSGSWQLWVCDYDPPGNFVGQKPY